MQVFINNNARFCYQRKKSIYQRKKSIILKYELKKIKIGNLINDDLEKVCLMSLVVNLIMILMMKQNQMMRKIMMNLTNNLLKAKKAF